MNAKVKGTVWCHLTTRCHSFALHVHKNKLSHLLMMKMPALHHAEHCIISYSWNIMRWMLYIAVFRSCILCFYCMTWWEESWCSNVMQLGFWTWSGNCPLQSRHKPTQSANQARCTLHCWRHARHSHTLRAGGCMYVWSSARNGTCPRGRFVHNLDAIMKGWYKQEFSTVQRIQSTGLKKIKRGPSLNICAQ